MEDIQYFAIVYFCFLLFTFVYFCFDPAVVWKLQNYSTLSLENCMLLLDYCCWVVWLQLSKDNHHEENGWFFPVKHKMQQSLTFQLLYINWRCQNTFKVLSHIFHLFFHPLPRSSSIFTPFSLMDVGFWKIAGFVNFNSMY